MDAQQFLAEFGHIANAPGGIERLRELVLHLAVTGKLVEQNATDECAKELLARMRQYASVGNPKKRGRASKKVNSKQLYADGDMPPNWVFVELGELGDWGAGSTPSRRNSSYYGGTIPWFKSGELKADYITSSEEFVSELALKECSLRLNIPGDVLIAMYGANIGQTSIVGVKSTTNQAVCACTPHNGLNNRFLLLTLRAIKNYFIGLGAGGAQPNISKEKIVATCIGLPPSEEQSRIVAKLDELMALCDTLEAQQQARRELQNKLRQSTLQAVANATSPHELQTTWARLADNFGRLFHAPEDLIDLDQCIKQLALKGLLSVWAEGEMVNSEIAELTRVSTAAVPDAEMDWSIPDHWVWARCAWLGEARLGKMLDAAKNKGDFRPYLRNINVRWGRFDLSDVFQMRIEKHELSKVSVRKGDLVICEGGEPGRAAVWSGEEEFVIQKALHRFRCNEHVLPEYMLFCLEHDYFSGRLSRYFTGATIKHLTGRALAEYPIPLPPVDEQKRILVAAHELMHSVATLKERLIAGNRCAAAFAAASVSSLTGIAIEQEEEPMKAPQTELVAPLRLGAAPDIKAQAPLSTILARHHGEMSAKDLWQRFGGEIDAFYAQLKTEVAHGWILEPAPAEMREKPAETVSA